MTDATDNLSIAIETSSRSGGVALGRGDERIAAEAFDASARHATQLLSRLDALLARADARPGDLREVYVSAGPGSFTGLRIGVTVARTLAQAVEGLRCVAVPTARALADGARETDFQHLAVALDARHGQAWGGLFALRDGTVIPVGDPVVAASRELLASWPRPLLLVGEATAHEDFSAENVEIPPADSPLHVPTAEGVWRVGRRFAREGQFTDPARLLPIYSRKPEALRLWQQRNADA